MQPRSKGAAPRSLFTQLPTRRVLGNPYSPSLMLMR